MRLRSYTRKSKIMSYADNSKRSFKRKRVKRISRHPSKEIDPEGQFMFEILPEHLKIKVLSKVDYVTADLLSKHSEHMKQFIENNSSCFDFLKTMKLSVYSVITYTETRTTRIVVTLRSETGGYLASHVIHFPTNRAFQFLRGREVTHWTISTAKEGEVPQETIDELVDALERNPLKIEQLDVQGKLDVVDLNRVTSLVQEKILSISGDKDAKTEAAFIYNIKDVENLTVYHAPDDMSFNQLPLQIKEYHHHGEILNFSSINLLIKMWLKNEGPLPYVSQFYTQQLQIDLEQIFSGIQKVSEDSKSK